MGASVGSLSQVAVGAEQRDLLHRAMDSVGLPTESSWQDGTPSDMEPMITPPRREITSKTVAPRSEVHGVWPLFCRDDVATYAISDAEDGQLPTSWDISDRPRMVTTLSSEDEVETEVITITDSPPNFAMDDLTDKQLMAPLGSIGTDRRTEDLTLTDKLSILFPLVKCGSTTYGGGNFGYTNLTLETCK